MARKLIAPLICALFLGAWSTAPADGGHLAGSCAHTHVAGKTLCDGSGTPACTTKNGDPGRCVQLTNHCQCRPSKPKNEEECKGPGCEDQPEPSENAGWLNQILEQ